MENFEVHLDKESLVFSAAHFITFNGDVCERIHGHNWRIRCTVRGVLDENRYVIDFIALRDALAAIALELDHHVLLPANHGEIRVKESGDEVEARFRERRWIFPREDCVILPVENTTAEEIARYVSNLLRVRLGDETFRGLSRLTIGIDENLGQWAYHTVDLSSEPLE